MICPECKTEFRGGRFYLSGQRGAFRRCPQGHKFKEKEAKKLRVASPRTEGIVYSE